MLGFDLVHVFDHVLTVPLGTAADSSYFFAFAADQHRHRRGKNAERRRQIALVVNISFQIRRPVLGKQPALFGKTALPYLLRRNQNHPDTVDIGLPGKHL